MTSPLVTRLLAQIERSISPEDRGLLLAELACYWARTGEFDEADALRRSLRSEFGDGHNIRVSILIMCIEAHLSYYRELSPNARDRMARASLLSKASGDSRLMALTSAWLAHFDFNLSRFGEMLDQLRSCFRCMDADDGTAECRAALVLGDAFLFVNNPSASRAWYERARMAAVRVGDQAALGAMAYNRAALLVATARLSALTEPGISPDIRRLRVEVDSAINYQALAQIRSLDHLLQSAKVGVLMLDTRFEEALEIIRVVQAAPDLPTGSAQSALLEADKSLALAHTGSKEAAAILIQDASEEAILRLPADDRALVFSSIGQAAALLGQAEFSSRWFELTQSALAEHARLVGELRPGLSEFEP